MCPLLASTRLYVRCSGSYMDWPDPDREALLATFGMSEPAPSDSLLLAVATLALLADSAGKLPLMVAVDDAHWLDSHSAEVLGLVARRLGPEPVMLLMAVRDGYETRLLDIGAAEVQVNELDDQSAADLLDSQAPELSPGLRARVLEKAAGNPMAIIELSAAVRSNPAAVFGLPLQIPITARLQQTFAERFLCLPAATRAVLLVASADSHTCLTEVLTAVALLGDDPRAYRRRPGSGGGFGAHRARSHRDQVLSPPIACGDLSGGYARRASPSARRSGQRAYRPPRPASLASSRFDNSPRR